MPNRLFAVLLLLLTFPMTLWGAEKQFGVIDSVDLQSNSLVIDDWYYTMALDMKVYDRRGDKVNRYYFKQGQKVQFTVNNPDTETPQLKAVWVLPDSAVRPRDDDD